MGTVPHGLIAAYGGDTVLAARKFADRFADELSVTVLVDFENDSVRTALEVADALGPRLWGVRLDTSSTMVDRSLWHEMGRFRPTGVVPELVWKVRRALDDAGHGAVRIVASGGFDAAPHPRVRAGGGAGRRLRGRAPRCCAAPTTTPPTWCASTACRARRWAARSAPTRASSWSGERGARPDPPRGLRRRRPRRGHRRAHRDAAAAGDRARDDGRAGRRGGDVRGRRRRRRADPPARPRGRDRPLHGQARRGVPPRRLRGPRRRGGPRGPARRAAPSSSTSTAAAASAGTPWPSSTRARPSAS